MPASMPLAVFSVPVMRGVLRLPNFEDPPGVSRQKHRTFASRLCPAPLYSYFHVYALNTCAYVPSVVCYTLRLLHVRQSRSIVCPDSSQCFSCSLHLLCDLLILTFVFGPQIAYSVPFSYHVDDVAFVAVLPSTIPYFSRQLASSFIRRLRACSYLTSLSIIATRVLACINILPRSLLPHTLHVASPALPHAHILSISLPSNAFIVVVLVASYIIFHQLRAPSLSSTRLASIILIRSHHHQHHHH